MPDKFNKISRELRKIIALSTDRDNVEHLDNDDFDTLIDELYDDSLEQDEDAYDEYDDEYNDYDDDEQDEDLYDEYDDDYEDYDDEDELDDEDGLDDKDGYNEYDDYDYGYDDYEDYDNHGLIDILNKVNDFADSFSDLDDDELTREIQELLDKINENKYDAPSNSAMRDFYSDDETVKLFKQNGWPNTANREFYRAKNKIDKLLRNRQYQFDNSKGLSGAFLIPVTDYNEIIDSSDNIVKDVIQDFEDSRVYVNKKSKKWDTSKQLRTGGK
jgi:hypothetical protein